MFKRKPVVSICSAILLLATAEGGVAWHYLQGMQAEHQAARMALEHELKSKSSELNRVIFLRDAENRLAAAQARTKAAVATAVIQSPTAPAMTADEELAEAAARAMSIPMGSAPRTPMGMLDDEAEEARELAPEDIDPKHLVNMVNIMTGKKVAELTQFQGNTMIHYPSRDLRPGDEEPLWQVLDAVKQSHALKEIILVGAGPADIASLKKMMASLVESGIPSRLIHLKTDDAQYHGHEGILVSLNLPNKRRRS